MYFVFVVIFVFNFSQIIFVCIDVALCYLVHGVLIDFHLFELLIPLEKNMSDTRKTALFKIFRCC